jgi:hypothetical protein
MLCIQNAVSLMSHRFPLLKKSVGDSTVGLTTDGNLGPSKSGEQTERPLAEREGKAGPHWGTEAPRSVTRRELGRAEMEARPVAIRGSVILTSNAFWDDFRVLCAAHPGLDRVIADLALSLLLDYGIREVVLETSKSRYAVLDPLIGGMRFAVMFEATEPRPSPSEPYRTISLARIVSAESLTGDHEAVA